MPPFLTTPDEITAENLTAILRESGALARGAVAGVERRANPAFNSQVDHLRLTYSVDAPSSLPSNLVLKRNLDADWAVRSGAAEVAFYRHIATLPEGDLPMILRPVAAAHDSATGRSRLLLPDLSATHHEPTERVRVLALDGVPDEADLLAVVDTLAAFHAYWWCHTAIGSAPLPADKALASEEGYRRYTEQIADEWSIFSTTVGDDFPLAERQRCAAALTRLPGLWERFLVSRVFGRRQITLCHGDCYFAAFLCPRDAETGRAVMIDWQGPEAGIGARDLVYLFATFWTPEQRRADDRERRLLRRYHAALGAHGVADYGWDDLVRDYRLMLSLVLFLPIWDAVNGSGRVYWWPKYSCLSAAYQDWRCAELVARGESA